MLQRALLLIAPLILAGCDGSPDGDARPTTSDAATRAAVADGPRPNIVFVLIDTLRADRLGAYGGPEDLTPTMDALAAEGALFERGIAAAPWTLPSVASLFSGVYPAIHRANDYNIALKGADETSVSVRVLSNDVNTLAERLNEAGYDTAGFVANVFLSPKFGLHQGFEHYDHSFVANTTPGSVVNRSMANWLATRQSDEPFFAYLHYMDVHAPYTDEQRFVRPLVTKLSAREDLTPLPDEEMRRHPGYFGKSARPFAEDELHKPLFRTREYWWARYDAGVRQIDHYLGEVREELERRGVWENTLVIVTSDHGEALGEHGLWTHGLSAHQDQLHVPMIVRWPDTVPGGTRVSQSVRMFDLFPTILDYLGLMQPGEMQASSLRPLIEGDDTADRLALGEAVKENPEQFGLVLGKWKLLYDGAADSAALFDLDADPTEMQDVAAEHREVVERLLTQLRELRQANAERAGKFEAERSSVTPKELERLKTLGYVGDD